MSWRPPPRWAFAAERQGLAARIFFVDDPISRDDDTAIDASGVKARELSESFDFLMNTFAPPATAKRFERST